MKLIENGRSYIRTKSICLYTRSLSRKSHFLEKVNGNITRKKYKFIENKATIIFHESIIYPFENFRIHSFEISSKDFLDMLSYVEHFALTSL